MKIHPRKSRPPTVQNRTYMIVVHGRNTKPDAGRRKPPLNTTFQRAGSTSHQKMIRARGPSTPNTAIAQHTVETPPCNALHGTRAASMSHARVKGNGEFRGQRAGYHREDD